MKCIILTKPNEFQVQQKPIPKPNFGQVLIKVIASPINPADLGLIAGRYPTPKKMPFTPGLQGCGRVIQSGRGMIADSLLNKKVGFSVKEQIGSFSQYTVIPATRLMILDQQISYEHGAMSVSNPLTAYAFLDICKRNNIKAVIQSAASSQLGRMIIRLFAQQGIKTINIVRRQQQVQMLKKQQSAEYVLNSTDKDFDKDLRYLSQNLDAKYCFDAIGGQITGRILSCMPKGSIINVYGGLSWQPVGNITIKDLLFQKKQVKGFHLFSWMKDKGGDAQIFQILQKVSKMIKSTMRSNISKQFPLQKLKEGIQFYNNNMSAGKVIIKPWMGLDQ